MINTTMDKNLQKFLEDKGVEICHAGGEPFLVDNLVPCEWIEEYHKQELTQYFPKDQPFITKHADHLDEPIARAMFSLEVKAPDKMPTEGMPAIKAGKAITYIP